MPDTTDSTTNTPPEDVGRTSRPDPGPQRTDDVRGVVDNPLAFPTYVEQLEYSERLQGYHTVVRAFGGMTLRDYFAAHALTGLLSGQTEVACEAISYSEKAAAWSYEFADALLAERAKEGRDA